MNAERGALKAKLPSAASILVCFAVRDEAKHFRPPTGLDCKTIITGMGQRNAEQSVRRALESFSPALLLTCGYAGGLNPELKRGDVLFDADAESHLAAGLIQLSVRPGTFHCAERIATTVAAKQALRLQTNADAVEMESQAIRKLSRERGIPAATIRVISDDAGQALPLDFNQLAARNGNISYVKLAAALMKSPELVPKLMRFRRELDECSRNLSKTLSGLLAQFL